MGGTPATLPPLAVPAVAAVAAVRGPRTVAAALAAQRLPRSRTTAARSFSSSRGSPTTFTTWSAALRGFKVRRL